MYLFIYFNKPKLRSDLETHFHIFSTLWIDTFRSISAVTTILLSVTRYIIIRWPFFHFRKSWLVIGGVILTILILAPFYLIAFNDVEWNYFRNDVLHLRYHSQWLMYWYPHDFLCLLGLISSCLSVWELRKSSLDGRNFQRKMQQKSSTTILLLNLVNTGYVFCWLICFFIKSYPLCRAFFPGVFIPALSSAINPLIIIVRSTLIRKELGEIFNKLFRRAKNEGVRMRRVTNIVTLSPMPYASRSELGLSGSKIAGCLDEELEEWDNEVIPNPVANTEN